MEQQIPETEQWLLDGDCDKCRKEKYCDKDCSAFKKAVTRAMCEAYNKAIIKAQAKWNAEHPYTDQQGNHYATEEEAKQADERINNAKEDIDEPCDACALPINTETNNNT